MKNYYVVGLIVGVSLVCYSLSKTQFYGMDAMSSCGEEVLHEFSSSSHRYVATLYLRNCGATVAYVTHINLRKSSETVFVNNYGVIADGEVFSVNRKMSPIVYWGSDNEVDIKLPDLIDTRENYVSKRWESVSVNIVQ